jgi:uncharacterized protein
MSLSGPRLEPMRLLAVADQAPHLPLAALVAQHRPAAVVLLGDLHRGDLDDLRGGGVPVLGVYGNHDDGAYLAHLGFTDLHLRRAEVGGVSFAGFQGSPRYRPGAPLQVGQDEADRLAARLPAADVLLAHAPPAGVNEEPGDRAHAGFAALRAYAERHAPRLVLHGHTPPPRRRPVRLGPTLVVHVVGAQVVDVPGG